MEDEGILVGFAAQHHTINYLHKALCLCEAGDAAIDDNSELWEGFFDGKHPLIAQGRDFAIFFWAQSRQDGDSGVNDKYLTPRCGDLFHKLKQIGQGLSIVNANSGLHRYRAIHLALHAGDAASN